MIHPTRGQSVLAVAAAFSLSVGLVPASANMSTREPTYMSAEPGNEDFEAQVIEVTGAYPSVPIEEVRSSVASQGARMDALAQIATQFPNEYAGAWFDFGTGTQYIQMTTKESLDFATQILDDHGTKVKAQVVPRSLAELEGILARLTERGFEEMGFPGAIGSVEEKTNDLDAYVKEGRVSELQRAVTARSLPVTVRAIPKSKPVPDVCVTVAYCGIPLRSGIDVDNVLNGQSNHCSVGFALNAVGPNTDRWFTTAGHCSRGNVSGVPTSERIWNHAGSEVGRTAASCNLCSGSGSVDVARVKITSAHVLSGSFGWLYNYASPNSPVELNGTATTYQSGIVLCLKSIHAGEISDRCGIVDDTSDAAANGRMRIRGYDSCPGDSGGAWFWTSQGGQRYGYASNSSSWMGCHVTNGETWATTIAAMNSWNDVESPLTLRVITR